MALKPDRKYTSGTDISYFMNETASRGIVVVFDVATTGSGAAMDDAGATVSIPTGTGGDPAGILLNDVVNLDLTRQHINWHKDEVQLGGKVTVLRNGYVVTDQIATGIEPVAGNKAYHQASGQITTADGSLQPIGRFLSSKDADGYAKVEVNL